MSCFVLTTLKRHIVSGRCGRLLGLILRGLSWRNRLGSVAVRPLCRGNLFGFSCNHLGTCVLRRAFLRLCRGEILIGLILLPGHLTQLRGKFLTFSIARSLGCLRSLQLRAGIFLRLRFRGEIRILLVKNTLRFRCRCGVFLFLGRRRSYLAFRLFECGACRGNRIFRGLTFRLESIQGRLGRIACLHGILGCLIRGG